MKESKYTYHKIYIPPLSMVTDLLSVTECGFKTSMVHAYLTFKTNSKKLQFGSQKCKKLHVGKIWDVISTDGRNIKNVKARVAKGKGIVNRIVTILDGIPY